MLFICLRGWPGSFLPLTGSLIVRLSGIFGPLKLGHISLLVQICPSYQLHPEGQASPVCSLSILPQPFISVLAEHKGSFRSGCWNPGPNFPGTHHTPSDRPGKCSIPRAHPPWICSNARPGQPPAEREQDSVRCTQHPPGASRVGPGHAEGEKDYGQSPRGTQRVQQSQATAEGITCATCCKRLREARRCWFCSVLRQETWRSWGRAAEKTRAAQDFLPGHKSPTPLPTTRKGNMFRIFRNLKSCYITYIQFI